MALDSAGPWLWDKFGKDIVAWTFGKVKQSWDTFKWEEASQKYRLRVRELYSTMRMLGSSKPVLLEDIFTDVYLLDAPTAFHRFDIEHLKTMYAEHASLSNTERRVSALRIASQQDRLFILGKPGAGKTTLLKYLTVQASIGKLDWVPIFISLNDWANSGLNLIQYIVKQFEICAFPDAELFVKFLLSQGKVMVMFDGLDEVSQATNQQAKIARAIIAFTNQYQRNRYLVTCRIAASEYSFEEFSYVEIADFTQDQVRVFARKWFNNSPNKYDRFWSELNKEEQHGLRELAQTPLLLALLCLNFEETLTFPQRRSELYEEAIEALLKKWDASRGIKRDEVYRLLSLGRKRQLFSHVAATYYEQNQIFFRQDELERRVIGFLSTLPVADKSEEIDGEVVIRAIEAQHGILVERAHRIYSFSHLSLQEYFTARHIVDNAADGTLIRLVRDHMTDNRWHDVFLLVASILPAADTFITIFRSAIDELLAHDEKLMAFGRWATNKASRDYRQLGHPVVARATAILLAQALDLGSDLDIAFYHISAFSRLLAYSDDRAHTEDLSAALDIDLARALAEARMQVIRGLQTESINGPIHTSSDTLKMLVETYPLSIYIENSIQLSQKLNIPALHQALKKLRHTSYLVESPAQALTNALRAIITQYRSLGNDWRFTSEQHERLMQYEDATLLLVECLQLAAVSDRKAIEDHLLLPPDA